MPQDTSPHDPIHIALTFDDKYWAPAYTTMRSICLVSRRRENIVFHLLHFGLSEGHRQDLEAITAEFGSKLVFYDLDNDEVLSRRIDALPKVRARLLNKIVYVRLFLTDLLPADAKRIIYIDCDMMVRVPIEELADLDLQGHPLAAATDPYRTGFQSRRNLAPTHWFDTTEYYFNAGLLVLDRDKVAEVDIVAKVLSIVTPEEFAGLYYDQEMLNIAFRNDWLMLSVMWNFQNPSQPHEAINPHIIHYTGGNKPWLFRRKTAFKHMYRYMMTNEYYHRFMRERIARRLPFLKPFLRLERPQGVVTPRRH